MGRHIERVVDLEFVAMTNREYARVVGDMAIVNRVAQRYLDSRGVSNAPVWEREVVFNEWLESVADARAWSIAKPRGNPVHRRTGAVVEALRMKVSR